MNDSLGADDVRIWYRRTAEVPPAEVAAAGAVLSGDERARGDRFLLARHRRDFVLSHDLLRRSLSRCGDLDPPEWRFACGDTGKPALSGTAGAGSPRSLSFNLSHTDGLVACAVTRKRTVGVDVERLDGARDVDRLAERWFSPRERTALRRCGEEACARFYELWTLKEALVKAIGTGLAERLDAIAFDLDDANRIAFAGAPGMDAEQWQFALYAPSPDARLAVAARAGPERRLRWEAREEPGAASFLAPLRTSRPSAAAAERMRRQAFLPPRAGDPLDRERLTEGKRAAGASLERTP